MREAEFVNGQVDVRFLSNLKRAADGETEEKIILVHLNHYCSDLCV